jgi:hypothetical protein
MVAQFDQTGPLLIGLAWLGGLSIAATVVIVRAGRSV